MMRENRKPQDFQPSFIVIFHKNFKINETKNTMPIITEYGRNKENKTNKASITDEN